MVQKPHFQLKRWSCVEEHHVRDFPNNRKKKEVNIYNVQEYTTLEDVGRIVPRLYPVMDNIEQSRLRLKTKFGNPIATSLCI